MNIWEQFIAPVRPHSFIVAGAVKAMAMTGCRRSISRPCASLDEASDVADRMEQIIGPCPEHQKPIAAIAAMSVTAQTGIARKK